MRFSHRMSRISVSSTTAVVAKADKLKARFALIIGDEELKAGTLVLRDMRTKEQRNIREEELFS